MKNMSDHTHSHRPFTHYILFYMSFPCSAIIYEAHKELCEKLLGGMLTESRWGVFFCLTVVCWFAEKRPQRCIDWWEGMIYVAPVSQLSSGPLSLITAIRLPLHRRSPCLRPAITASLLSHIHKGKGCILSPRLPLQRYRDAKKGASMCSGGIKSYNLSHYSMEGALLHCSRGV